jgi:cobalt/nickel transport system permease protein
MLSVHALIGVGEALITIAALSFIATTAPDLLGEDAQTQTSLVRRVGAGAGATVAVVALAALFASTDPDGLNSVATALGFSHVEVGAPFELFAGYGIPGLNGTASTIVAALIGAAVIVGLLLGLSRLAASRTGKR